MVVLDYRDARPIYTQICDGFREQIRAGILQPGEKLPSVRELAMELTINPNTIQRAYRELELQGWIASVPGKGSFVCEMPLQEQNAARKLLLEFDSLTARLRSMGVSIQSLQERLEQGGKQDA